MTQRRKDLVFLGAMLVLLLLFFSKILFTDKIIRAPDIINEFYWGVLEHKQGTLADVFDFSKITADWNIYINGGITSEGGIAPIHFLFYLKLLFYLFPAPASVAWCIVLHLFFGSAGVYLYCRAIGLSAPAAFLGGLIFAVAPENASLINAGHVMKIATISFAPWAFYLLERGLQSRRVIFFLATGLMLALQFFNTHWQIAFYTCLALGVYGLGRLVAIAVIDGKKGRVGRLVGLNVVMLAFFLSTVSIALLPLANWSQDTNRGVQSGANQGKGGLDREEAMLWSLPPEEVTAFFIPGLFGLSRQEAGANPANIDSYYWGRMTFTQTASYMGLLPWLLVPLPLIFRRDRYTWLAVAGVAIGVLFSMGKFTPFYNFLFDHFPGINRFRVPKMMMFVPVMGLGVLAARAVDLLRDDEVRGTTGFRRYLYGISLFPVALLVLLGVEIIGKEHWVETFIELLAQPTRYEQGPQLIVQRWGTVVKETGIAAAFAAAFAGSFWLFSRKKFAPATFLTVILALFLLDVGRVDAKFLFLVPAPERTRSVKTPAMEVVGKESKEYRVLPMNGADPMHYVSNKIPVMFTSNAVQQRRWQEFLDAFSLTSSMPDILNVKYVIFSDEQFQQQKQSLLAKYQLLSQSPDGSEVVLQNRDVLPKAWLVPAVVQVQDSPQNLAILQNPQFNPRRVALVESPPPIPMAQPDAPMGMDTGMVAVDRYEGETIQLSALATRNSLLVLGEKYYRGWKAVVDGKDSTIYPVDHILRGIYLTPGKHEIRLFFDPLPFKVGRYLTLGSFLLFVLMLVREFRLRHRGSDAPGTPPVQ